MSAGETKGPEGIEPGILAAALNSPPDSDAGEDLGCDAYALWAALTRLGHEVKLQGRAFAALREALEEQGQNGPGFDADNLEAKVAAVVERSLGAWRENAREAERTAEAARKRAARAEEDLLRTLADVHDRLSRGLEAARKLAEARRLAAERQSAKTSVAKRCWLCRWLSPGDTGQSGGAAEDSATAGAGEAAGDDAESWLEGQELALRRVADELSRRGLREIAALGELFDPLTMQAVAVDPASDLPAGTVTAVLRGGWMLRDEVWRAAEVMVVRSGSANAAN